MLEFVRENEDIIDTVTQEPSYVQFNSALTGAEELSETFLNSLPASKLSIVVWQGNESTLFQRKEAIASAIRSWKLLGNTYMEEDPEGVTFSVKAVRRSIADRKSRSFDKHLKRNVVPNIVKDLSSQFGWNACKDKNPTLSFQLVVSSQPASDVVEEYEYSLELIALVRVFPLRNNKEEVNSSEERKKKKPKRIESFFIARSANVQNDEYILDPICSRATFLIEAAKYWPLAHYHGIDSNIPNLEHARMNADSTKTNLVLVQGLPHELPVKDESIDKILTRMPFGKSQSFYHRLILEWARVLKWEGKMFLIINQSTVNILIEAIHNKTADEHHHCSVSFVRTPSFLWGTERVTLITIQKAKREQSAVRSLPYDILDWEKEYGVNDDRGAIDAWARERAGRIPSLIPYSKIVGPTILSKNKQVLTY